MKPARRKLVYIRSRGEPIASPDPRWWSKHGPFVTCSECFGPSAAWIRSPRAVNVHVTSPPRGFRCWLDNTGVNLFSRAFHERLAPHARGCRFGKVYLVQHGKPVLTDYVSWIAHPAATVRLHRGLDGFYKVCPGCDQIVFDFGSEFVMLQRELDDRKIYLADHGWPLLDKEFLQKSRLRERFPDLRAIPVRVVDDPEDGETLPGDPGWNGVFIPRFTSIPQRERILEQERTARSRVTPKDPSQSPSPSPPRPQGRRPARK